MLIADMLLTRLPRRSASVFLLLFVAMLAGCRSERVAFHFQPLPAKVACSAATPFRPDSLLVAGLLPPQCAAARPPAAATGLSSRRRKSSGLQRHPTIGKNAARRASTQKVLRATCRQLLAKPRQAASEDNALVFAVLFGLVGLLLLVSGLVTWLGVVLLVAALLFLVAGLFGGKWGG